MNPAEYEALSETEDSHWWFRGLRRDVEEAVERFAPRRERGLSWLDAGCGTGGLLASLTARRAFRLAAGLDVSADALRFARRRRLPRLVRGAVARLPFPDGSLDCITAMDVLYHRDVEPRSAVVEASRCLAPGGVLILQVPAFEWLTSAHDRAVWTARRFDRRQVLRLVTAAGLEPRLCVYRNSLLFPMAVAWRLLTRTRRAGSSDVRPASALANAVGGAALSVESALRRAGLRAPFGLSIFCVASR